MALEVLRECMFNLLERRDERVGGRAAARRRVNALPQEWLKLRLPFTAAAAAGVSGQETVWTDPFFSNGGKTDTLVWPVLPALPLFCHICDLVLFFWLYHQHLTSEIRSTGYQS